jgi:hypothetical protein
MTAILGSGLARGYAAPSGRRLWRLCLVIGLIAVAVPALITPMPPLLDYPNHVTRIWLLAGAVRQPPLSSMYAVDWGAAWTNVGVDLASQILGAVIPGRALAPLFLAAALVLPPLGAALLHKRLFGGWRWWQVGLPLAAFSTTLLAGFLNYQIGLGLALAAASLDPWLERRASPAQLAVARVAFATGLLVAHIFALGFYGVLLAGLALGPRLGGLSSQAALRATALRLAAAGAACLIPLIAFTLLAPALPGGGVLAPLWGPATLKYKLDVLLCAFAGYDLRLDCLFLGAPAVLALWALLRRRLAVHQGLLLSALGLVLLAVVSPTWAADTAWIDTRIPIMALLALMTAVDPEGPDAAPASSLMAVTLLALVLGRAGFVGSVWMARQADIRSLEAALSHVPPGAAVLPLEHKASVRGEAGAPIGRYFHFGASFYHYPTLAVLERRAFSPLVFTTPGKQPLRVREPWKDISVPNGGRSPPFWALIPGAGKPALQRIWLRDAPYIRHWRQRFDYALMLNCDVLEPVDRERAPEGLRLIADEGFARLYRVDRKPAPGLAPQIVSHRKKIVPAARSSAAL